MKRVPSGLIFFSALMIFLLSAAATLPEWMELLPPLPSDRQMGDWVETVLIQLHLFP